MNDDFSYTILEYINNAIRNSSIRPLNLGGISSSGGGSGTPPGGFVGYLPQTRVSYDLSEVASSGVPASGMSLLDNLNHIRYDIDSINTTLSGGVGVEEAPVDGEQYARQDGDWVVVSGAGADSGILDTTTVSTNTTLDATYTVVNVDAVAGNRTITVPAASSNLGKVFTVKKADLSSTYWVRVICSTSNIDEAASIYLRYPHDTITIISDGTQWRAIGRPPSNFVPEGSRLQVGGIVYPTTSFINIGDGDFCKLYEKYDDCFAVKTAAGDVFVGGYDATYSHIVTKVGDIDSQEHGHYLDITASGFAFNGDVTISGGLTLGTDVITIPLAANLGGTGVNNGAFNLTVPATGTVALLATANVFTVNQFIDGSADAIQLKVQAHSTQTANVLELQTSAAAVNISMDNNGGAIFNEQGNATGDLRAESDTEANMLFLDADADTDGALYFGGTTNGVKVNKGGELTLLGTATVFNDANVGSLVLVTGGTLPGVVELLESDGGSSGIYSRGFAVGEQGSGSIEIPHDYKEGSNITFHVHWVGQDAPSGTDNVKWQLTYSVTRGGVVTPAATTVVAADDTAFDTQYMWMRTDVAAIVGTSFLIGDQFNFTLTRILATGDAYAGEAIVATLGFHYECDSMGSKTISAK